MSYSKRILEQGGYLARDPRPENPGNDTCACGHVRAAHTNSGACSVCNDITKCAQFKFPVSTTDPVADRLGSDYDDHDPQSY